VEISIIGSRGIPAKYGGFETFAEQLAIRLVKEGHHVSVSCEYLENKIEKYFDVKLLYFPFPPPKYYSLRKIYEILNDIYFIANMARSSDIMYILGVGTAGWVTFLPKLLNKNVKIFINIDGLEWKRNKFNRLEKKLLKFNNYLAIVFADTIVIDSKALKNHMGLNGKKKAVFVSYGIDPPDYIRWDPKKLMALSARYCKIGSIMRNEYWLVVARLEPENNIHIILESFLKSNTNKPLLIIGEYSSDNYREVLNKILVSDESNRVFMVGAIYNDRSLLYMLRQNCFSYIHGHSVGGTNPSLLEAMASKNAILAHDNEFNREVCADGALYFKNANDLVRKIELIESDGYNLSKLRNQVYKRVLSEYSWEKITNIYSILFNDHSN